LAGEPHLFKTGLEGALTTLFGLEFYTLCHGMP